jgi:hypothetical protein
VGLLTLDNSAERVDFALHGADFRFDAAQVATDRVDRTAMSRSQHRLQRQAARLCVLVQGVPRLFEVGLVQLGLQPPPPGEQGAAGRAVGIALASAQHGQLLVEFSIGTFHGNTLIDPKQQRTTTQLAAEPRQALDYSDFGLRVSEFFESRPPKTTGFSGSDGKNQPQALLL